MSAASKAARIKGVRVFVPTRGSLNVEHVKRLAAIRDATRGFAPVEYVVDRHDVVAVRNAIVAAFMDSDGDVLVSVDDDCVPHKRFLDGLPLLDRFGVVGWPHPIIRPDGFVWSFGKPLPPDGGVEWVGTACIAIRRDVLEALGPAPFRHSKPFMDGQTLIGAREDVQFSEDARAAGFLVGVDCDRPADHLLRGSATAAARLAGFFP